MKNISVDASPESGTGLGPVCRPGILPGLSFNERAECPFDTQAAGLCHSGVWQNSLMPAEREVLKRYLK
jgi:hypothetical protein